MKTLIFFLSLGATSLTPCFCADEIREPNMTSPLSSSSLLPLSPTSSLPVALNISSPTVAPSSRPTLNLPNLEAEIPVRPEPPHAQDPQSPEPQTPSEQWKQDSDPDPVSFARSKQRSSLNRKDLGIPDTAAPTIPTPPETSFWEKVYSCLCCCCCTTNVVAPIG